MNSNVNIGYIGQRRLPPLELEERLEMLKEVNKEVVSYSKSSRNNVRGDGRQKEGN